MLLTFLTFFGVGTFSKSVLQRVRVVLERPGSLSQAREPPGKDVEVGGAWATKTAVVKSPSGLAAMDPQVPVLQTNGDEPECARAGQTRFAGRCYLTVYSRVV